MGGRGICGREEALGALCLPRDRWGRPSRPVLGDTWVINPHATTATIKRQIPIYRTELAHAGIEDLLCDRFVLGSPEDCYAQLRPC